MSHYYKENIPNNELPEDEPASQTGLIEPVYIAPNLDKIKPEFKMFP